MHERKIARDARTGRFISRRQARRGPRTTVVETIPVPTICCRCRLRVPGGYETEENQNERAFKAGKDL